MTVANYIRRDIYANNIYAGFAEQLQRRYGQHLERLLDLRRASLTEKLVRPLARRKEGA